MQKSEKIIYYLDYIHIFLKQIRSLKNVNKKIIL